MCPGGGFEKRLNSRQTIVAEFEDEDPTGLEVRGGLRDEIGVKLVAFFTAVECDFGFVIADFAHERRCFAPADVGRIAGNEIEKKWRVTSGEWRARWTAEKTAS